MLTKKDIQLMKETFVTREELYQNFATKEELQEVRRELKNDILNFKDAILGEIVAMRQELQVVLGYRGLIQDHEERIETMEKVISL